MAHAFPLQPGDRSVARSVVDHEQLQLGPWSGSEPRQRGSKATEFQLGMTTATGSSALIGRQPCTCTTGPEASRASFPAVSDALAVKVEDLHKSFRIPTDRVDSLKERVVRPFAAPDYRVLKALDGISFEVLPRASSSTSPGQRLWGEYSAELLASIYRADPARS